MNRSTMNLLWLSSLVVGVLLAPAAMADTIVIKGATVHSMAGEPAVADVVITDGRIESVATNVSAPAGATVIDAEGKHVYPGIIDAWSQIGLIEINSIAATVDAAEMGRFNSHLVAAAAVHPSSELIPVARANGVLAAVVAPQTSGDSIVAGQSSFIHLDGWTVEEMAVKQRMALAIRWPGIVTRSFDFSTFSMKESSWNDAKKKAHEQQNDLRDWFDAARHYKQAFDTGSGRTSRDLQLEGFVAALDGELPVVLAANESGDIEAALDFAAEYDLEPIIAGGRDAWKVKERLAEEGVPVILGLTHDTPDQDDDPYDRPFRTAGELYEAGVTIAFATGAGGGRGPGGPHLARTLPYEAAAAVGYGLPPEAALAALTIGPARVFGIDDQIGTIEAGKIANLMITDGNPLEITTTVEGVVIAGRQVSLENRHQRLYEKHASRPLPGSD